MEKRYGLKIGDDIIYLKAVLFDDTTLQPLDEIQEKLYNMLINTDKVINLTDLNIMPNKGAIWNGTSFSDTESRILDETSLDSNGKKYTDLYIFAYLQNDIVMGLSSYDKGNEKSEMMAAALSSDPQIIEME